MSAYLFAQDKEDIAFQKLKTFASSCSPYRCVYNKFNHTLKIGGFIIDLKSARFEYTSQDGENYVSIKCEKDPIKLSKKDDHPYLPEGTRFDKECIFLTSGETTGGVSLGFNTENDCYTLINLIAELRNAIKPK